MISSPDSSSVFERRWLARLDQVVVVVALFLTAAMLVVYAWLAAAWQRQPYPGFLLGGDATVMAAHSFAQELSGAELTGLRPGDRVLALADTALAPGNPQAQVAAILADRQVGDELAVRFAPQGTARTIDMAACSGVADGQECTLPLTLARYPGVDLALQFGFPWLTGIGGLIGALLILRWRWTDNRARLAALIATLLALVAGGVFDMHTGRVVSPVATPLALVLLGGALLRAVFDLPSRLPLARQVPAVGVIPVVVTLLLLLGEVLLIRSGAAGAATALTLAVIAAVTGWGGLLAGLLWRARQAVSPAVRGHCSIVIVGMLLGLAPLLVWAVSTQTNLTLLGQPLGFYVGLVIPFLFLLPAALWYALAQRGGSYGSRLTSQSVVYGVMAIVLTAAYAALVAGVTLLTGSVVQISNPLFVAVTVFLMVLAFNPLRMALEKRLNRAFFRGQVPEQQGIVEALAQELTRVSGVGAILGALRGVFQQTLAPTHSVLFLPDDASGSYRAYGDPLPETDIRFDQAGPLIRFLGREQRSLFLGAEEGLPAELASERARLAVLSAHVLLPLRGKDRLAGFVAVGPRASGERYRPGDLVFLQSLADQIALAVERAQVMSDLEQRIREMNVLGQVAQAVNYTVEFEDLLELIFTQSTRVVEAEDFAIALRDPNTDELYYSLYVHGEERLPEREGVRWRMGRDLVSEVVRTGQPLRVDNYGQELERRAIDSPLESHGLRAWLGVPLSAPGSALGAVALGSTAADVKYSDEQLKILWQIADQAAMAIDKARLFRETEIRARQLSALNEISTQLATVFQDNDRLLELITESAVEILQAEAGSLLLIDLETHDLEFKVATGSQGRALVGRRLPPGTGLVGNVAARGEPVIVNDTTRDPRWYSGLEDDGKFHTSSLIAAPLNGNAGVIGVLEVLNKRDGGVFVDDDKRLLVAFAGQAAIAIENARLFQMTDQQLAARVEELDTMQKIDRELNETLRLQRVLNITLDWALRESGANAGALGMAVGNPPGLQIMAHYGYPPNAFPENMLWPLDRGIVARVMRSGRPDMVPDVRLDKAYLPVLEETRSQLTVPLFTGGKASGVIILESAEPNAFSLMDMDFVSRLAEHASPAVGNAILLAELERANASRSEFVGFVAHELKTPMTSIKGFAELLLGGVVGPLNDQQKGFLGTIRSNVERMNTLVSDLNDVTKLQTDRMTMDKTPVSFNAVVKETLRPLTAQIEAKRQTLRLEIAEALPPIYADRNRIIQVLTNLLTNANKYTPEGGELVLSAVPSANEWDPAGPGEVLHVAVRDNGIGISEEDQRGLFQAYFRTNNPEALEQPGTGLGLVIVRGIVEQHGGRIWLESAPGQGTTFHLTLPLASAVPEARQTAASG